MTCFPKFLPPPPLHDWTPPKAPGTGKVSDVWNEKWQNFFSVTLRNFSFTAKSKKRWGGGLAFRFRTCSQWHRKPDFPQGQRVDHSLMKKGFESEESGVPFIVPINAQTHHRLLSSYCQIVPASSPLPPPNLQRFMIRINSDSQSAKQNGHCPYQGTVRLSVRQHQYLYGKLKICCFSKS